MIPVQIIEPCIRPNTFTRQNRVKLLHSNVYVEFQKQKGSHTGNKAMHRPEAINNCILSVIVLLVWEFVHNALVLSEHYTYSTLTNLL